MAWLVRGPSRSVLWLPDIDKWEKWDRRLDDASRGPRADRVRRRHVLLADEIPGRAITEIPHPLVPETEALLAAMPSARGRVFFVHLNHTNRLLWDPAALAALDARGFGVAREGQRIPLAAPPEP